MKLRLAFTISYFGNSNWIRNQVDQNNFTVWMLTLAIIFEVLPRNPFWSIEIITCSQQSTKSNILPSKKLFQGITKKKSLTFYLNFWGTFRRHFFRPRRMKSLDYFSWLFVAENHFQKKRTFLITFCVVFSS